MPRKLTLIQSTDYTQISSVLYAHVCVQFSAIFCTCCDRHHRQNTELFYHKDPLWERIYLLTGKFNLLILLFFPLKVCKF